MKVPKMLGSAGNAGNARGVADRCCRAALADASKKGGFDQGEGFEPRWGTGRCLAGKKRRCSGCMSWGLCDAYIERRPRGASRAKLAPTFVSGQLFLGDLRANALVHGAISRRTNKAVARARDWRNWPETNVGASFARDAPRGRRSIAQTLKTSRRAPQGPQRQAYTTNSTSISSRANPATTIAARLG